MSTAAPAIGFGDGQAKLAIFGGVALLALSLALSHGPGLSTAFSASRGSATDGAWSPTSPSPPAQQIQQAPQAPAPPVALPGRPGVAPAMDPLSGRPGVAPADAEQPRGADGTPRLEGRPGVAPPDDTPPKNGRPGIPPPAE